jgi:hypothetical protein
MISIHTCWLQLWQCKRWLIMSTPLQSRLRYREALLMI